MTMRDDIRASLQAANDSIGESWQYRRRTSGPSAQSPSYGAWTAVTANPTGRAAPQEWDDRRQVWKRVERVRVRVSDALADLHQGDQLKDADGVTWAITGIASNALRTGTIAYECERAVPLKAESGNREAGA